MRFKLDLKYTKGDLQFLNFFMLTIAGVINACGVTLLLAPVNLFDSGVSGLAMFLGLLTNNIVPLWAWLIIINVPIFLFGMQKQGIAFTVYSLYAILIYSIMAAVLQNIIPLFIPDFLTDGSPVAGNELVLCSLFGGILSGMGSGITIRYGGTMDGMETLAVIFSKKLNLTVGNFVMIFNVVLYLAVGSYFIATGKGDFSIPLFSIIAYFANGKTTDFISQGLDQAKGALIITNKREEVGNALSEEFGRGLTVIDAQGFYSRQDKTIIYCVVNRFQVARMRTVIAAIDKFAFVTIMDISDVFGTSIKYSRANDKKQAERRKENMEIERELEAELKEDAAVTTTDKKHKLAGKKQKNKASSKIEQDDNWEDIS
jgi:uncharacterized membrane-anchored protein YitT (DUF2179 family)